MSEREVYTSGLHKEDLPNTYLTGSRAWGVHYKDSDYDLLIMEKDLPVELNDNITWRLEADIDRTGYEESTILCVKDGYFVDAVGDTIQLMVYDDETHYGIIKEVTETMKHLPASTLRNREYRCAVFQGTIRELL